MKVDWSNEDSDALWKPGAYEAEVLSVTGRLSKNGDPMLNIRLGAVAHGGKHLAYDNIMCGGKGRGLGQLKLMALGVKKGDDIDPQSLVGRRVWAHVIEDEYQGKKRMAVAIDRGTHAGYSVERPDVGVVEEEPPANAGDDFFSPSNDEVDDTPF